jgi:lipopolysaccharide transport system permease protein
MAAACPDSMTTLHTIRIQPTKGWALLKLGQLWEYRELLWILVWRDLKVRYKQTVLGAAWAVLQPVLTMVVFTIIFGRLAKVPSDGLPYPVFVFCGLLPWQLFAYALNESGNSLVGNRQLITKVYFPRLVIPLSAVLAGLADFAIAFVVLLALMLYYGLVPTLALVALPLLVGLALATALSVGLWLSALNVEYRDVRYTIPFLTQIWFFLTPIPYSSSLIPEVVRPFYGLNPMAGVVEGFRWVLLGAKPPGPLLWVSLSTVLLLLVGGLKYFRRMERTFADVV